MEWMRRLAVSTVVIIASATACWAADTAEVAVWNYEILGNAYGVNDPGPVEPIRIVGTRNGSFSGAVAVESAEPITGLRGSVGALSCDGAGIPAEHVSVRYAVPWTDGRRLPGGLDILLESAPAEIPAHDNRALVGVWVTVDVPEDARPGRYTGELTVEAEGLPRRTIPVELTVAGWRAPDPRNQRTWIEVMQSPDTLAMEYDVPLWSDRHWSMIARSFQLIRPTGSRVVYIPLLRHTNQGNAEAMVRWIPREDGSYEQDYSVMEKYLDLAQDNLGKLELVVFQVWDAYLTRSHRGRSLEGERPKVDEDASSYAQSQQRKWQKRWDVQQQGLTVTMLDQATGKTKPGNLPHYRAPESRALWKPVFDELRRRMKARGLEEAMTLGMICDQSPSREQVEFLHDVSGGLSWMAHAHTRRIYNKPSPNKVLHEIADIRYEAHVRGLTYHVNPAKGPRMYGWRVPELRAYLDRFRLLNGHALRVRQMPQLNITGDQRGIGRIGADFWHVIRDSRGRRAGQVFAPYPQNHWRGLNISNYLLAPGADGPVATARLENLLEGVQECEARICIEEALLDEEKKKRLGSELAERARKVLDEHQLAMWRSIWTNEKQMKMVGAISGRSMHEGLWHALGKAGIKLPGFWDSAARKKRREENRKGIAWFVSSDWRKQSRELYEVAAEVQHRLR